MLEKAESSDNNSVNYLDEWSFAKVDTDLYDALEVALNRKAQDMVDQVDKNQGFEFLRRLSREFDLQMPNIRQLLTFQMMQSSNEKAKMSKV